MTRILDENLILGFCERKKNDFLIKIQIWFGFFKYERKTDFYFKNINFFTKNADLVLIKKNVRFLF